MLKSHVQIILGAVAVTTLLLSPAGQAHKTEAAALSLEQGWSAAKLTQELASEYSRISAGANSGNARAQYQLATWYEEGKHGLPADIAMAMSWYEESARNGYPKARKKLRRLK